MNFTNDGLADLKLQYASDPIVLQLLEDIGKYREELGPREDEPFDYDLLVEEYYDGLPYSS